MLVAIVTGASHGIGCVIALRLADDGFDVAINDLPSQQEQLDEVGREIRAHERKSVVIIGDVSDETDVQRLVDDAVSTLGELNVMIANAGLMMMKGLLDLSISEFEKVQAINVKGVFLCYQKVAKQMIQQGKGRRIAGACSISGYRPQPSALTYRVSKWAVRGLTQASAIELAPLDINVNAYCPGMVKTPMWDHIDATISEKMGVPLGYAWDKAVNERPAMKKPATVEDIAGCVSVLVGKDSKLITGGSVIVDGGIQFS